MTTQPSRTIAVSLLSNEWGSVGLLLRGRETAPYTYICDVIPGSSADKSKLIKRDDILVQINGIDITRVPYDAVSSLVVGVQPNSKVDLVVRAPKGKECYLRTCYDKSGAPTVTRVLHNTGASSAQADAAAGRQYERIRNFLDDNVYTDTLHTTGQGIGCDKACMGSVVAQAPKRPAGTVRPRRELVKHMTEFMRTYYDSIKRLNSTQHQKRLTEILQSIEATGTYDLTFQELTFGAKQAWRNAVRCIGRIQWSKLQIFDCRNIRTAKGMYDALCKHVQYGTNGGNIRSAITIFPHRTDGKHDFRVWNQQIIRYAGYKQPDGSIIGDPTGVEITKVCMSLGWKPKEQGRFDVLPWVLQANGQDPELFEIPADLIQEVHISHPTYKWFEELGMKWYTLPGVSNMKLDCGGLEFIACPFNGWYMGTEIGARNFCDPNRYNIMETVANMMGLDTRNNMTLWKDQACIETNIAVLYSFQKSGVTISDHHTASDSFIKHMSNEQKLRGGCPADWVWVVPPISGSLCKVFHQEMLNYRLYPLYEYQADAWHTHVWEDESMSPVSPRKSTNKLRFKDIARAVKFSAKLMARALATRTKCTIMYATETGKSETFAQQLREIFMHAFDVRVCCMNDYDIADLEHEQLLLCVTSTFGNGDPPDNGEELSKEMYDMMNNSSERESVSTEPASRFSLGLRNAPRKERKKADLLSRMGSHDDSCGLLRNLRYSVFALGSRAYPHYCAFGHCIDQILGTMGAEQLHPVEEGDELCGQEQTFQEWANDIFKLACKTYCVGDEDSIKRATKFFARSDLSWAPGKYRLTETKGKDTSIYDGLGRLHRRNVVPSTVISSINLQAASSGRQTMLLKLDTEGVADKLSFQPGDHVALYPANNSTLVDEFIDKLINVPDVNTVYQLQLMQEIATDVMSWVDHAKMPPMYLKTAFIRYLDLNTPPTQAFLKQLQTLSSDEKEQEMLGDLATDTEVYEEWKHSTWPNMVDVLTEFPKVRMTASFALTQLPLLQPRYYSISSSPAMFPGEIHCTVAVVAFQAKEGAPTRHGVCSNWIKNLKDGDNVPCFVRSANSFHLPKDKTMPVVMIGPGTGIAPFRSFWQQRMIEMETAQSPPTSTCESRRGWGDMSLYFGCRRSDEDWIYRDETQKAYKDGVLAHNICALSREPELHKTYVQDQLWGNSRDVYEVLRHGHVYVCGDVSMASQVEKTLEGILQKHKDITENEAAESLIKMRDSGRYHEDIFGVTLNTTEVQTLKRKESKKIYRQNSKKKTTENSNTETDDGQRINE